MALVLTVKSPKSKFLRVTRNDGSTAGAGEDRAKSAISAPAVTGGGIRELVGKAVFFASGGHRVAGKVARVDGGNVVVNLAVPNREGLLIVTDSELTVKATDTEVVNALMAQKRVAMFEAGAEAKLAADTKATTLYRLDEKGKATEVVEDYLNVVIEGHASTFGTPEKRDRGREYVIPGAWNNTLIDFRKNPVMLTDHANCVDAIAGSWEKVGVDAMGLAVRGRISNAPNVRNTRFKLMEGHLKGLSIGGIWYYAHDGYGIEEADLFEISLVAVPMNPDTLAHTRSVGEADCQKAFARFWRTHSSLQEAA